MIKIDILTLALLLSLLLLTVYTLSLVYIFSTVGVYSVNNSTHTLANLDLSSVSDFEDSFMLLSDSILFIEQDGVFIFDYYMGVLVPSKT